MKGSKTVKKFFDKDVQFFRDIIERFIYESVLNSAYTESYLLEDAKQKCSELSRYLQEDKAIVYGALYEEKLVGFVWAYKHSFRDDQSRIYISIVHVDECYRNQSYGELLLHSVEQEARRKGMNAVYLHAEAVNSSAVRFYNRMGYENERIQLVKDISLERR